MKEIETQEIKSSLEKDLIQILKDKGIWEKILDLKIQCYFCNETITTDNIGAIVVINNGLEVCCMSPNCIEELRGVRNV